MTILLQQALDALTDFERHTGFRRTVTDDIRAHLAAPAPVVRELLGVQEIRDILRSTGFVTNDQAWEAATLIYAHGIGGGGK